MWYIVVGAVCLVAGWIVGFAWGKSRKTVKETVAKGAEKIGKQ